MSAPHSPIPVVLFGTGELPRTVRAYLDHGSEGRYAVVAFTCDREYIPASGDFAGLPVLPFEKGCLADFAGAQAADGAVRLLLPVGFRDCNRLRERKYEQAKGWDFEFITYVHPSVQRFPDVTIGENSIVFDHATIQPGVTVGHSCLVWPNAIIGHGTTAGSCCWFAGGTTIAGDCSVGDRVFFGANSAVKEHVSIGSDCIIGIGAVITRDTASGDVYLTGANKRFFKKSDKVAI